MYNTDIQRIEDNHLLRTENYIPKNPDFGYTITYDANADGYQLCSEIEWDYAGSSVTNKDDFLFTLYFYHKHDSVGLPIPNVEFKISEPNSEGVGEIITKGPNVMLGYYKNEEATKKALRDGWFYTGDLGRIDENGYLYITGRSKSVIVTTNGKNIYRCK